MASTKWLLFALGMALCEEVCLEWTSPLSPNKYLRATTFNTWLSGASVEDGVKKIARHVNLVNPDVIMFQEIEGTSHFNNIRVAMGKKKWHGFVSNGSYPDTAILTRHYVFNETYAQTDWAMGFKINVKTGKAPRGSLNVSVWATHLQYQSYGPYPACNKLVKSDDVFLAGEMDIGNERPGRLQNIRQVLANTDFQRAMAKSEKEPVLFAGDFNAPSHQDWTDGTKDLHCGWAYAWPVTKALTDSGFDDSFRMVHRDARETPGTTWSTVQKYQGPSFGWLVPEPQDRIDFIFFKGSRLHPTASFVYHGHEHISLKPNHTHNHWPSDHSAVVTDFAIVV